jgi:glycosyltransferase involved in cell wall biosynthesis
MLDLREKKKICLVIPSLQAGGMERVMSELAGHFCKKSDLEVHMILYGRSLEVFYPIPENLILHKPGSVVNDNENPAYIFGRLLFLRNRVRKLRPHAVLSFGEYWNSFVILALLGLDCNLFISDRCTPERKYSTFHSFLRRFLYPVTKGIVAQTIKAREIYSRKFNHRNIEVIGNPIREVLQKKKSIRENQVLMIGRFITSKNQDKLIEMFISIGMPEWKLVLVGYDHLKQNNYERLKEIVSQNNEEDKVIFAGKQADVDSYYTGSKIFAFTSGSEGFPNVIGEAMSAGLPVIAFDCVAGPSDMITDNHNGFLIPLYDYKQFQEKLEMLMRHEELRNRFGRNAKKDIIRFSVSSIGEKYYDFILGKNMIQYKLNKSI